MTHPLATARSSWLRRSLWLPVALALPLCIALAQLHFTQQTQLRDAVALTRKMGQASRDLAQGMMHIALADSPGSVWEAARGRALLRQALADFESAVEGLPIPAQRVDDFRRQLSDLGVRLTATTAEDSDARRDIALRLALFRLDSSARGIDALLLDDLEALQQALDRAFMIAFAAACLFLATVTYLTYRTQARALAAMGLLDAVSEASSDAIFAKDLAGRYLLFNAASSRFTSTAPERVLGATDEALLPKQQAAQVMAHDREVVQTRTTRTFEEELETAQGPRTFLATKGPLFDHDGRLVGIYGISRDISERKKSEREAAASRAQLAAVIEALDEGLVLTDSQGEMVHWNRAALTMHGYEALTDVLGPTERFRERFALETLEGQRIPFDAWPVSRVLRGERLSGLELRVERLDRPWRRIFSFGGTIVHDAEGRTIALLTISDVTARHQAEESVRRLHRIEAIGTLAAGVAHDFNNILLAIGGNATLARRRLATREAPDEELTEIERATVRAADLVRRILLFASAQESQRAALRVEPLVDESLKLLRPTTPAMIELRARVGTDLPAVNGDASQLHQVIINLVTNAVHAVDAVRARRSGVVTVALDALTLDAPRLHGDVQLAAGPYLRLSVEDNGCGMAPEVLARVFDPFFTTKPTGKGTGLGLSVTHGIVRTHGGAIAVHSEPEQGTRVEVLLPATSATVASTPARTERRPLGAAPHVKRVLYVDDEDALVLLVERALRKLGYEVSGFLDPREAVAAFAADPARYDVVVTDLAMPSLSGFDVAAEVRRIRPDLQVVMMSGYVRPEDRARGEALGIRDILLKPSRIEELADAIDRQLHAFDQSA